GGRGVSEGRSNRLGVSGLAGGLRRNLEGLGSGRLTDELEELERIHHGVPRGVVVEVDVALGRRGAILLRPARELLGHRLQELATIASLVLGLRAVEPQIAKAAGNPRGPPRDQIVLAKSRAVAIQEIADL